MSKRIFHAIWIVALVVFVSMLVFVMGIMYEYTSNMLTTQLKAETDLAAHGVEHEGISYINDLTQTDYRITWIAADGEILYDSKTDTTEMENHLERQEVRDAMAHGSGGSTRYSTTMTTKLLYQAQRLPDGSVVRLAVSQYTALTLFLGLLQPILFIFAAALLISFFLARRISTKIVEPLNNLDFHHLSADEHYKEIAPLINRLNAQQAQLRSDQVELERTEQIRREFTANVSHELKTPLHTISGYAELIKDGLVREEDIKPFAGKIYAETYRMTQLVEDIIELTKLDEGATDGAKTRCDLHAIAQNAVESLFPFAAERDVDLCLCGISTEMNGVPHLLYGIVYNLCDNAIKYNRPGGKVQITVSEDLKHIILTVADNGIGISPEHQSRIFERFYRVDKSHSKEVGGTGLGLSIVKHSAQIHRAAISLRSEIGIGTAITVTFPKD
ncbi:MAG: PAS domain-containing sensor histidine kinase [Clostridiales bacterium]|nr:PAS domain-containing sensor histidine kinase [Candidatus Cacconaster stercorequi]